MKRLLTVVAVVFFTLPVLAWERHKPVTPEVWINPANDQLVSEMTPVDLSLGAGIYIGSYQAFLEMGMKKKYAKWSSLVMATTAGWFTQRHVVYEAGQRQASFVDVGWTLGGAVLAQHFWGKWNAQHAEIGIKHKQLVFNYNF